MRCVRPRVAFRPHRGGWVAQGPGFYVFEEDAEQARRLGGELAGASRLRPGDLAPRPSGGPQARGSAGTGTERTD